jgi:peroxiredoxin
MSSSLSSRSAWIKPVIIGAVLLALALGAYVSLTREQAAPEVTFIALDGKKITTESLRGKVVIVYFWATSCVTCVKKMPQLIETYQQFKPQGVELVGVTMQYDPPNYVLNFTKQRELPFIVAMDTSGEIAKSFGDVTMTPTTIVVNKQGKIIKQYVGEYDLAAFHSLLQQALAAEA